jgi:Flp pilus assembly pilin Flp
VNQLSQLRRIAARMRESWQDIDGQGLAEYALILALIAIVAIVAMIFLGQQVSDEAQRHRQHVQSVQ